jgi:hypothetical protein
MESFANSYQQPDIYFKITDQAAPQEVAGDFIPVFIGLASKHKTDSVVLTRQSNVNSTSDVITTSEFVISVQQILDSNNVLYNQGVDYTFSRSTTAGVNSYLIQWNVPQSMTGTGNSFTNLPGTTLILNVNGVTSTITFATGGSPDNTALLAAAKINATFVGIADGSSGYVKLTGNLITIIGGTSLSVLGFIIGQKVISIEPATGIKYTVNYTRDKIASEYTQQYFTNLSDLNADQGPAQTQNQLFDETSGTGISIAYVANSNNLLQTLTDTAANFTTYGIVPGNYIKITNGSGVGQIRVILEVTSATVIVVESFNQYMQPDTSTNYSITDIGQNQTSIAAYYANKIGGAQEFMTSQSIEDIVDDNNWRKAVDNTIAQTDGAMGYCMVPLRGMDSTESLVAYIKTNLVNVNSVIGNQERICLMGIKQTNTSTQINSFLTGIAYERIGVITAPSMTDGGITYGAEYIASIIAGYLCNPDYDSGEPITNKPIPVDSISTLWLISEEKIFGGNGGIVIDRRGINYKIIDFVSTNVSTIFFAQMKVTKQKDAIKKKLRAALSAAIIGTRATTDAPSQAASICNMILNDMVTNSEIYGVSPVVAAYQEGNPSQLNINFTFQPMFDNDYLFISFGAQLPS